MRRQDQAQTVPARGTSRSPTRRGTVSDAKTDAGILYLPTGPVAVCVLTAQNADKAFKDDNAANVLIGRAAQLVISIIW